MICGDCLETMRDMEPNSVDAIVTDPPYELGFMGKSWDNAGVSYDPDTWREALRVLKPGGYLLAFGGTRTYHRMAVAIEDAGFILHPMIGSIFGSGFPKATNLSKRFDREAGAEREIVAKGRPVKRMIPGADQDRTGSWIKDNGREFVPVTDLPATDAAQQWQGWYYGRQSLKPALEPICMAQKPANGRMTDNVLEHGTGAINVDGCRIDGIVQYRAGSTGFGQCRDDGLRNRNWLANITES